MATTASGVRSCSNISLNNSGLQKHLKLTSTSLSIPNPNSLNWNLGSPNSRSYSRKFISIPCRATQDKDTKKKKTKTKKSKTTSSSTPTITSTTLNNEQQEDQKSQEEQQQQQNRRLELEDVVNPVGLGRRSRKLFDEVWRKFSGLGQISSTRTIESDALDALLIREGPMCEFVIPGAQNTTVLVVGATSRIGRIVVRKLMLRGYTVKALVRNDDENVLDMLPRSVQIVVGDVGDPSSLNSAVQGCNKIIYCATARSAVTGDLFRVDHRGVYNLTKAFQVL